MKKLLLLILVLTVLPVVHAQRVFYFGIESGLNGSQISGDTYAGFNQPGAYAGIYTRVYPRDSYSVQLGFAFSQKGSRRIPRPEEGDFTLYKLRLNYIEIPLVFRFPLKRIILEAGLLGAYLISYKEEDQFGKIYPERPFKRGEFGGYMGAGYLLRERIDITIRATSSFLPVRPHQSGTGSRLNNGQYNSALTFLLRYTFISSEDAKDRKFTK